jgi:hypothetical protein
MPLKPFVGAWPLFQFLDFYTVGRTPWTGNKPVARPLRIQRAAQTQNKSTQTSMPPMGFEPTIPVFEWEKMVHVLDREAALIGLSNDWMTINNELERMWKETFVD